MMFILFFKTPSSSSPKSYSLISKIKRIDFLGIFSIVACLVCTLLALNWGGTKYSWGSTLIIVLFSVGFILLIAYIIIEYKVAEEPITPLFLFKYRNITFSSLTSFFQGYVISIFVNTMPLYYQDGILVSATEAGLRLLPLSVFYSFSAMVSGCFVGKWGHIVKYIKFGSCFACIATYLLTLVDIDTSYFSTDLIFLIFYGLCTGVIYQNCLLVAQRVSPPEYLSISITICTFFNYIGGVVGVAIYGALLQNIYPKTYQEYFPNANPVTINDIHNEPFGHLIYVKSIKKTYLYAAFPVSILIFVFAMLIKECKNGKDFKNDLKDLKDSNETLRGDEENSNNSNHSNHSIERNLKIKEEAEVDNKMDINKEIELNEKIESDINTKTDNEVDIVLCIDKT
eukprot:jgi/Orpsp1_1/1176445/evm.model.c7180000057614.1